MRVLIIHNRYSRRGGEDDVVDTEMAQLRSGGHEVAIMDPGSADLSIARAGFELAALTWNPVAAATFRGLCMRFRPDVVHAHNLFPRLGPSVLLETRRLGLPLVMTLHNYRWLCPAGTFTRAGQVCRLCAAGNYAHGIRHGCLRRSHAVTATYAVALTIARLNQWPYRLAHRLACVSEAQRKEYLAAGWPAEKLLVKSNFIAQMPAPATEAGEGVLFLGRLSEEKGPRILLDAWKALNPSNATLSMAGEGPLEDELQRDTPPGVRWLGFLGPGAVKTTLASHACLTMPSIWPETFGLAAVQAMACGRPVVASAIGGLPELVQHGETGLLVEPGNHRDLADKLRWMLDHPEERQAMGRRARAFALERYGPETGLRAMESLYEQTIAVAAADCSRP
jgi:glycosyltransferase involved in cell wall biosynthesis